MFHHAVKRISFVGAWFMALKIISDVIFQFEFGNQPVGGHKRISASSKAKIESEGRKLSQERRRLNSEMSELNAQDLTTGSRNLSISNIYGNSKPPVQQTNEDNGGKK